MNLSFETFLRARYQRRRRRILTSVMPDIRLCVMMRTRHKKKNFDVATALAQNV